MDGKLGFGCAVGCALGIGCDWVGVWGSCCGSGLNWSGYWAYGDVGSAETGSGPEAITPGIFCGVDGAPNCDAAAASDGY